MAELLIELFSEEIPARMQGRAAEDLAQRLGMNLSVAGLPLENVATFSGPRRLALRADMAATTTAKAEENRGPRKGAPRQAIEGFVDSKVAHPLGLGGDVARGIVVALETGDSAEGTDAPIYTQAATTWRVEWRDTGKGLFLFASINRPPRAAKEVMAEVLPYVLRAFPWPKSMRWGTSPFLWVRPLHRVVCVLGGEVLRFPVEHGITSGNETEGHRIHAPEPFAVTSHADYLAQLRARKVVPDAAERMAIIREGVAALAAAEGLEVVPDEGLLAEVAGLVEWPVPLLGRIDDAFMDLPPEVMRTTMRINQKYFALRHPDGRAAPRFALVANIEAHDGGAALVAGNERVLRARLSDARFFWDLDRKHRLGDFLPKLENVVFHAKLGTQGQRVRRLVALAKRIAEAIGADVGHAERAAELAKADLATGMVGEFPELQGIMGRYYALASEPAQVAEAIGAHYRPLGPTDAVPTDPVAVSVALADKLDQLAGFFAVDEKPTGSGDPFALRRAALGVIRMVRENGLRLGLRDVLARAAYEGRRTRIIAQLDEAQTKREQLEQVTGTPQPSTGVTRHDKHDLQVADEVLDFLFERLRVQLRAEGARHDVVNAVLGSAADDDLVRLLARAEALRGLVESEDGANLLAAYRRAANLLRIEEKKDATSYAPLAGAAGLAQPEELVLVAALDIAEPEARRLIAAERFAEAMAALASLRAPLDAFFDKIMVNDPNPELRANRLRLLARLRAAMDSVADLSKIDG